MTHQGNIETLGPAGQKVFKVTKKKKTKIERHDIQICNTQNVIIAQYFYTNFFL
jgi:hypothetical protein